MFNVLIAIMKLHNFMSKISLFLCFITLFSACQVNAGGELSDEEIERIFQLCPDDTLMVLGDFIKYRSDDYYGIRYVGNYYLVADMIRKTDIMPDMDLTSPGLPGEISYAVNKLYKTKRGDSLSVIAIPANFIPLIKISEELSSSSLKDMIIEDITPKNVRVKWDKEVVKYKLDNTSIFDTEERFRYTHKGANSLFMRKKDDSKYVFDTTNLAKVFFLQEKETFIKLNAYYYWGIRYEYMEDILHEIKQHEEQRAQSTWKEYL